MAEIPPKWVLKKYARLWVKFHNKSFTKEDAEEIMNGTANPSNFYSELKNHGWLRIDADQKDARRNIYTLQDPKTTIEEIGKQNGRK
jgi:hypothetical protein